MTAADETAGGYCVLQSRPCSRSGQIDIDTSADVIFNDRHWGGFRIGSKMWINSVAISGFL